eukprot:scaffold823_cov219-Amphora_coffeaeformis.AAC.36
MLADKGFPFLGHGQEDTATGLNGTDTTAASLEDALAFVAVDLFVPKELGACVVDDEPIRIITHGQVYQRAHRSRLGESHNDTINLRRLDNIIKLHEVTGTDLAILLRDSHHKQELPVIIQRVVVPLVATAANRHGGDPAKPCSESCDITGVRDRGEFSGRFLRHIGRFSFLHYYHTMVWYFLSSRASRIVPSPHFLVALYPTT